MMPSYSRAQQRSVPPLPPGRQRAPFASPEQDVDIVIQSAIFINLFFAPMLSLYLHYKKGGRPLKPSLELLFQYGIAACCNYALARLILLVPQKLLGSPHSVDSAHYAIAALLSAWLLPQLYKVAKQVKVELDFTRLRPGGREKGGKTNETGKELHHEEATGQDEP